jgi:enoyl-CoA hydratase
MGVIQEIAPNPGIRALSIGESEAVAFAKLNEQFGALFHTKDFLEGRQAEAAGRPPVYQGC